MFLPKNNVRFEPAWIEYCGWICHHPAKLLATSFSQLDWIDKKKHSDLLAVKPTGYKRDTLILLWLQEDKEEVAALFGLDPSPDFLDFPISSAGRFL